MDRLVETTQTFVAQYFNLDAESVYVSSLDAVIKQMETMMASFSLLMGSVASISLFVGGIGIMNMMLTNVTEMCIRDSVRSAHVRGASGAGFARGGRGARRGRALRRLQPALGVGERHVGGSRRRGEPDGRSAPCLRCRT